MNIQYSTPWLPIDIDFPPITTTGKKREPTRAAYIIQIETSSAARGLWVRGCPNETKPAARLV